MSHFDLGRRRVMQAVGAGLLLPGLAPAVIASVKDRPQLTDGVQSGDLLGDRAMIWSRSDRPARMVVEWDTRSVFSNPRRFISPLADNRTDFTARVELTGLPAVQAKGFMLSDPPRAQVSLNLLDHTVTSLPTVWQAVESRAIAAGVRVLRGELIGLIPLDAALAAAGSALKLETFARDRVIEARFLE